MPDDMPPLPHFHFSSLFQFLTLIFVARGEVPLTDGVVGGESLFGDSVVSGDSHGQDAGVWDHTARGCLATVPANVGTHWGRKRGWRVRKGGFKKVEHEARERGKVVATKGVRRRAGGGEEKGEHQLHRSSTAHCLYYSLCPFLPSPSWEMFRDFGQDNTSLRCFFTATPNSSLKMSNLD